MNSEEKTRIKLPIDTWPVICCGTVLSAAFFLLGVDQMIASYVTATDPYSFLMLFFSSSMIILINATIFSILVVLGIRKLGGRSAKEKTLDPSGTEGNDSEPF
jgi:hypothetical protein